MEPHALVLELSRAKNAGDRYAFRMAPQVYNRRLPGGAYKDAELSWDQPLLDAVASLRDSRRDPEVTQRLGNTLRAFLEQTGWTRDEREIHAALDQQRRVVLTIRAGAAELYALPWELVTLGQTMRHVGALPNVLIRYEWADSATTPEEPSPRPEGGRILFAWSRRAGDVPAEKHLRAIQDACDDGHHDFDPDRDVLPSASLRGLRDKLEEARNGRPVAVLHILCHGGPVGSTFGLSLDPDDDSAPAGGIDADRLAGLLAEYAGMVRLVVIAACDSGNVGPLGNQMGSVAQAIHRAGVAAVVASRYPFSKKASNEFAAAFYRALLVSPCSVEDAFVIARQRLTEVDTGRIDWASVQLYAREADGVDTRPVVVRPYQGLLPLGLAESRFFFGREKEAQEIVEDLGALVKANKPRFLVVQGWSGTGKSSMVMAGAVPRLTKDADPSAGGPGDPGWSPGLALAKMKPGADPVTGLERALFDQQVRRPALLVVDQLEEIFTHADARSRDDFARRLWEIASDPASFVSVIVTIRSDFIGRCGEILLDDHGTRLDAIANDEAFSARVSQLSREQLRETIEKPAAKVGLTVPPSLVSRILREIGTALGALPLIAHTMSLLWEERQGRVLTMDAYDRLGTVTGALHRHADGLVDALDEQGRRMAERLFVVLVGHEAEGDDAAPADTRRRLGVDALRSEVCQGDPDREQCFDGMLRSLVDGRLLVTEGEGARKTVEVAHEALIRGWPQLDGWLARYGDMMRRKKELDRWIRMNRDLGTLLNEKQIDTADAFKRDYPDVLSPEAEALLKKSRRWVALIWWTKRGLFAFFVVSTIVIATALYAGVGAHKQAEAAALDSADRALIAAAKERLARHDPLAAMQLLEVVQQPEKHAAWLGLALRALRAAPSAEFRGHDRPVTAVAQSRDGAWIATGSADTTARVWNARDVANVYTMTGHAGTIRSVAFSDDGTWIATGSEDHTARVWSARNPRKYRSLDAGPGTVWQVAFGAGDTLLTVSYDKGKNGRALLFRDALLADGRAAGPPAPAAGGQYLVFAAWSRDRTAIVTAGADGKAQVWDAASLREVAAVPPASVPLKGVALVFRDGDKRILTVAEDETAVVWDAGKRPPKAVAHFPPPPRGEEITSFCLQEDGSGAAVGYSGGAVLVWLGGAVITLGAGQTGDPVHRSSPRAHDARVTTMSYLPGETAIRLATASLDGTVRLWGLQLASRDFVEHAVFRHPGPVVSATAGGDGAAIVTGSSDGAARLWKTMLSADPVTAPIHPIAAPANPVVFKGYGGATVSAVMRADGGRVAAGADDGAAYVWDAGAPDRPRRLRNEHDPVEPITWVDLRANGERLLALSESGIARLWSAGAGAPGDGACLHDGTMKGSEGCDALRLSSARLSPDGKWVAAVSGDGRALLWGTGTPGAPRTLDNRGARTVAWSPDSTGVVTGSSDRAVRIWRAADAELMVEIGEHDGAVVSAEITPDGKGAVVVTEGRGVRLWNLDLAGVRRHVEAATVECLPLSSLQVYFNGLEGSLDPGAVHKRCMAEHARRLPPPPG